jgi:2-octaprenyl-6-methoxyphenol hydroxylase
MPETQDATPFDVTVAGGNYIGLTLALALARAVPGLRIAVVEPREGAMLAADGRSSAIAAAGRRLLAALGLWDDLARVATAVTRMEIGDAHRDDVLRPTFLTFEATGGDTPLAHMLGNGDLVSALRAAARAAGVELIDGDSVADFVGGPGRTELTLASGGRLSTRLLVAADGAKSRLRGLAGIGTVGWSYRQSAVTATIAHAAPHEGVATELFLPTGPIATLPLSDAPDGRPRSSLVWSEDTDTAARLHRSEDFVFEAELGRRLGRRWGAVSLAGRRSLHPLGLTLARATVKPRLALVGDAAHAIHPIAGQGLNLGLGDAAALAEVLATGLRIGRDPGALDLLEEYQSWRRFETVRLAATTDLLTRAFSNDLPPLRFLRDLGLGVVDRLPPLKRLFAGEAAGLGGRTPRLMAGEPL